MLTRRASLNELKNSQDSRHLPKALTMSRSFAGISVLAVAAGIGFAVHHFLLRPAKIELPFLPKSTAAEETQSPDEKILEATAEIVALAEGDAKDAAPQRAAELLDKIDAAYNEITSNKEFDAAAITRVRQMIMFARLAAVKVDRKQFVAPFNEFANSIIAAEPGSITARQATMLQVLAKYDLSQPPTNQLSDDIDRFAAAHGSRQGATLYCLVARDLADGGQANASEALLRRGLKKFDDANAKAMLINKLADLGFSKPPPPRITNADFQAKLHDFESRAAAAIEANKSQRDCPPGRT